MKSCISPTSSPGAGYKKSALQEPFTLVPIMEESGGMIVCHISDMVKYKKIEDTGMKMLGIFQIK